MPSTNHNLSLRALRVFCLAAELESFREAAEKSFLTSSAVSHQIKHLEANLGVKLFERTARSTTLSEAGRAFHKDMQPLVAQIDSVAAKHNRRGPGTSLHISVQPFFASELFVPRLVEFVDGHPNLDISVDTSDEAVEKHPDSAHVSIRVFTTPPAGLSADRLLPLHLVPAGSPGFYDETRVRARRIVSNFPLVVHESRSKAWAQWEKSSRIRLPSSSKTIRLASMIAVARAAERGLGAALVPRRLCESWFDSGNLVQLFDQELETRESYYLVHRKEDSENKNLRAFKTWVLQNFAEAG